MTTDHFSYCGDTLDEITARDLAVKQGTINLEVGSLNNAAVAALSNFQGKQIHFSAALPKMDENCARQLLKLGDAGQLSIDWLRAQDHLPNLERSTFLALTQYADSVDMDGFGDINTNEAEVLSKFRGTQLLLYVDTMSENTAKLIAMTETDLLMVSVSHMDLHVATALSTSAASDELQVVVEKDTISKNSATALSFYQGNTLRVQCKNTPSFEVMQQLARFPGHLVV